MKMGGCRLPGFHLNTGRLQNGSGITTILVPGFDCQLQHIQPGLPSAAHGHEPGHRAGVSMAGLGLLQLVPFVFLRALEIASKLLFTYFPEGLPPSYLSTTFQRVFCIEDVALMNPKLGRLVLDVPLIRLRTCKVLVGANHGGSRACRCPFFLCEGCSR